jgi:hypothetical protein
MNVSLYYSVTTSNFLTSIGVRVGHKTLKMMAISMVRQIVMEKGFELRVNLSER